MIPIRYTKYGLIAGLVCAIFLGCASQPPTVTLPVGILDDPYHAVFTGRRLLANGDLEGARASFEHALQLDGDYAPAMTGLAQVAAAGGDRDQAVAMARSAVAAAPAKSPDLGQARTALMEILLQFKPQGWFREMESLLAQQERLDPQPALATLVMGKGYEAQNQYLQASVCYKRVLGWNREHVQAADEALALLYQRLRAETASRVGREMAQREVISRGDLAAFLVEELKLPDFIDKGKPVQYQAGFQTPQIIAAPATVTSVPPDVKGHPFQSDIMQILDRAIRGLEIFPDGNFLPEDQVTRAGFALVMEDVLVRVKNEPLLKRAFLGNASPFPDVASDHFAFNAMIVCTTRNFLAANLDGAFEPDLPVSGSELLLAVRRLRSEIEAHQVTY